jgi:hypothetical protein
MENVSFAYLESIGKSKIWQAYADNFAGEEIMQEGFNPNSGYVYIALENGISICSLLGGNVEFLAYYEKLALLEVNNPSLVHETILHDYEGLRSDNDYFIPRLA